MTKCTSPAGLCGKPSLCKECGHNVEDKMNRDQFLTEKMVKHWHTGIVYDNRQVSRYKCSCMEHQSIEPLCNLNPSYSDWEGFGKLWEWAKEQEWFWRLCKQVSSIPYGHELKDISLHTYIDIALINPDRFADAVARYLGFKEDV